MEASAAGTELIVPAPALLEAYAVMTRLPSPHRLSPADALAALSGSLEGRASIVGLGGSETWTLLRSLAAEEIAGGHAYDAAILACAAKGGATRLLTLDARDFTRLDARGIAIVVVP